MGEGGSAPWFLGEKHTPSLTTPYMPVFLDDGSFLVLDAVWGISTKQGPSDRLPGSSLCFGMDPPSSHHPFWVEWLKMREAWQRCQQSDEDEQLVCKQWKLAAIHLE